MPFFAQWDRIISEVEVQSLNRNPHQIVESVTAQIYTFPTVVAAVTAAATGTSVPTQTEADVVLGGNTIILTVTGDTFVTGTSSLGGIAAGSDSDQAASGTNWDSLVKSALDNTDVVLSVGDTVATITLPAFASYDISSTETITWTIPAASLTTSADPIVSSPGHTVTASGETLAADSGTYSYTGTAVSLQISRSLDASPGSFSYSGTSIALTRAAKLAAGSGSFSYSGTDVALTYTPSGATYTLGVDAGAFTYTGTEVQITAQRSITADLGPFIYTGTDVAFTYQRTIAAGSGSYSYSGTGISITAFRALAASTGIYSYNGTNVSLSLPSELWNYQAKAVTSWADQSNEATEWITQGNVTTTWTEE